MNYITLHLVGYAWEYIYDARAYGRQRKKERKKENTLNLV
jgi:hypothetical protein